MPSAIIWTMNPREEVGTERIFEEIMARIFLI
jgi:hypothetical protein